MSAFCPKHDNTFRSSRADAFVRSKLLWVIISHKNEELSALVVSLSTAEAKDWEHLAFTAAQELLSAAKWYLAAVGGSFPSRCLSPSGDALCKFPLHARHKLWGGCIFSPSITALYRLTTFNTWAASVLLLGTIILLHFSRQESEFLIIALRWDPWWCS